MSPLHFVVQLGGLGHTAELQHNAYNLDKPSYTFRHLYLIPVPLDLRQLFPELGNQPRRRH